MIFINPACYTPTEDFEDSECQISFLQPQLVKCSF